LSVYPLGRLDSFAADHPRGRLAHCQFNIASRDVELAANLSADPLSLTSGVGTTQTILASQGIYAAALVTPELREQRPNPVINAMRAIDVP
jgi:hypothetical protein